MIFKCPCGNEQEYENVGSGYIVGDAQKATGWTWIATADGGSLWLCPSCHVLLAM